MNKITLPPIKPNERVAVIGASGSGKSFAVGHLLLPAPRLVVLDPKGLIELEMGTWNLEPWATGYKKLLAGEPARVRAETPIDEDEFEDIMWAIYDLRNVIVDIDELYGVGPASGSRALRALYTRGRALGIGVWGCMQRPRLVPGFALSEAEHILCFQLRKQDDREYIGGFMDLSKRQSNDILRLKGHSFVRYASSTGQLIKIPRIRVDGR